MSSLLRVGSRQSPLALAQTHLFIEQLQRLYPELSIELKTFTTQGDRFLEAPLSQIGDKGLFVKELEEALLSGTIDIAVHSLKDMLSVLPEGLKIMSFGKREDARDALVCLSGLSFSSLPSGSRIGTASLRRIAQLKGIRDDLDYQMVRGNLQTRFRKLQDSHYDALILASAGMHRMGWYADKTIGSAITHHFDPHREMLPAVGQGILAVEYRQNDSNLSAMLVQTSDTQTELAMRAERAFLKELEGGCRLPVAAYATASSTVEFQLTGAVYSLDGKNVIEESAPFIAEISDAEKAGKQLARTILALGGADILKSL